MSLLRGSIIALIVVLLAGLTGCGGGGGSQATTWPAYTPPPEVATPDEQADFASDQTVGAVYEVSETANMNPWAVSNANIEAVTNIINYVLGETGIFAASQPSPSQRATPETMAVGLAKYLIANAPQSEDEIGPAQSGEWEVSWTDEVCGIDWSGTLSQTLNNVSGTIHGVSTNGGPTDIAVNISGTLGINSAQVRVSIAGDIGCTLRIRQWDGETAPQCVEEGYETVDGRATLDESIRVSVGLTQDQHPTGFDGTWEMDDIFALDEDGGWVTHHKLEGTHDISGTIAEDWATSLAAELDYYFGCLAGDEFFWAHHEGVLQVELNPDEGLSSFSLSQELDLSNGMTGMIAVAEGGELSGWIKDAEEILLASISGNLFDGSGQIYWEDDGRIEEITWELS